MPEEAEKSEKPKEEAEAKPEEKPEEKKAGLPKGTVYVSPMRFDRKQNKMIGKELSVYENAVYRQFEESEIVTLKARGSNAIGRLCNLSGIICNQIKSIKIEDIKIGTERIEDSFVTNIEVKLKKIK